MLGEDWYWRKVLSQTHNFSKGLIDSLWDIGTHNLEVVPPPLTGKLFIPGRGDIILINPFLLKAYILAEVVTNLELVKWSEPGIMTFFQINAPRKEYSAPSDPNETNVSY